MSHFLSNKSIHGAACSVSGWLALSIVRTLNADVEVAAAVERRYHVALLILISIAMVSYRLFT